LLVDSAGVGGLPSIWVVLFVNKFYKFFFCFGVFVFFLFWLEVFFGFVTLWCFSIVNTDQCAKPGK
jgi:hypothetical protein